MEHDEERAYCDRLAEMILAYELNPLNFLKHMRARNSMVRPAGLAYNYQDRPSFGSGYGDPKNFTR